MIGPAGASRNGYMLTRPFGNRADAISILGFGGHHLGEADDRSTAERMVSDAVDGGINFFDNCWEYHRGKSEEWMGGALKGKRSKVFLMSKVCTHGRDKELALKMLEQSLRRLQTDHLDLWQIHSVTYDNDPDLFIRKGGAAEALAEAKRAGKVRYVGFTGHKDPAIHLRMLATGFPFDAVQMPVNPFDATFRSFQKQVIPEAVRRGMAVLGMKSLSGTADPVKKGEISAEEAIRFAMSVAGVTTTIAGMEKPEVLEQNLRIAQNFQPMKSDELEALAARVKTAAADGKYELFKVSLKYDNPEARLAHDFPIDTEQKEVKEMLRATENTGHPYPELTQ